MSLKQTSGFTNSARFKCLEDLEQDSGELWLSNCGGEYCDPGYRFDLMGRSTCVLHIVREGKGIFEINKEKYELSSGDAFFIPPNTKASYEADKEDPWSYMWVGFSGYKAYECAENSGFSLKTPVRRVSNLEKLKKYMDDMLEAHSLSYSDELKRNGCLMMFFAELMEDYKNNVPSAILQHSYPGSVYVTSNSTNIGGSTAKTFPLYERIVTSIFSFKYFKQSPNVSLFKGIWSYVSLSIK